MKMFLTFTLAVTVAFQLQHAALAFEAIGAARLLPDSKSGITEQRYEEKCGTSPFDKIGLHHLVTEDASAKKKVVLYLPGTNMNGAVAPDDIKHSLALYLAANGIDFWAMDYRTHFVAPTTAEGDLDELKDWSYELFADDVSRAVNFVRQKTKARKIFLVGFSRGVANEYLYSAMHPQEVKGLVVLDGYLKMGRGSKPPAEKYANDISGGQLTFEQRKALLEQVIARPDGPAPIAKYKTARENLEHVVYDAGGIFGGHGGLANPFDGKSDAVELAKLLVTYDRYWPSVQDYENPFTPQLLRRLKNSHIPVLAFSSTKIAADWSKRVEQSAQATGSNKVTVTTLDNTGHLDVLCGELSESQVFQPIVNWLKN